MNRQMKFRIQKTTSQRQKKTKYTNKKILTKLYFSRRYLQGNVRFFLFYLFNFIYLLRLIIDKLVPYFFFANVVSSTY